MVTRRRFVAGGASMLGAAGTRGAFAFAGRPADAEVKTVSYSSPGGKDLLLDLYLPQGAKRPLPVIVFVHGGGWFVGSRKGALDFQHHFAQDGFAMASIDYRLTPSIHFPSNVEDVKTAVRWVRANAKEYGLDAGRIGLWGVSAGGHLAAIAAFSPNGTFEGEGNLQHAGPVQCLLDAFGPSDLDKMDAEAEQEKATLQPWAPGLLKGPGIPGAGKPGGPATQHGVANSPESRLLGAPIATVPEKVRAASPVTYVHAGAPPTLLMHGLSDNTIPHGQSVLLYQALAAANNDVTLRLIDGLPHGFFSSFNVDAAAGPFRMDVREHLPGKPERVFVDHGYVYNDARAFFLKNLG